MKTLEDLYQVGQQIEVTVHEPNVGKFPIGKIPRGNVICLFEKTRMHLEIGSVVSAEIIQVKPRNLVIRPISVVKTKTDVDNDYLQKLEEFKKTGFKYGNVTFK